MLPSGLPDNRSIFPSNGGRVVVTDVRFPNELEFMRRRGASIWHIVRPGRENVVPLHESENGVLGDWMTDIWIHNDAGLEQLAAEVERQYRLICGATPPERA